MYSFTFTKPRSSSTFRVFQTEVRRERRASHSNQQLFRFHVFHLAIGQGDLHLDACFRLTNVLALGAGFDANLLLLEGALEFFRDFLVFHRHQARQHLENGHVGAELLEHGAELHAYRTGSDDRERFRHFLQVQDLDVSQQEIGIRLQPRQHARRRSRSEDDVLRVVSLRALFALDLNFSATLQRRVSLDDIHLVLLHQEFDALGVLGHDSILPVHHLREVQDGFLERNSLFFRMQHVRPDFSRVQQAFGGNAAYQEAGPA